MPERHSVIPKVGMVLAAGKGLRMRPITDRLPKPLIKVGDRSMLDHALDRLQDAGVETAVVNVHHLGHLIVQHLRSRLLPRILISREDGELLETGGGVKKALPLLGEAPFFVANGDVLWLDGYRPALHRLAEAWDGARMDALLMLHSTVDAYGYDGVGDFQLDPEGRIARRAEGEVSPYLYTGVQILHPRLFQGAPEGPFSLNLLYDRAIAAGRLFGMQHDGEWFHIGTPDGLAEAETYLRDRYPGRERRST
ncbi:MAG: nucleotidyltransferase family protein [Magnetospirillum sp. WYHS-4]